MAKKPTTTFWVEFKGGDVFPELIPIQRLVESLEAINKLIALDHEDSGASPFLSLIGIQRGSARLQCHSRDAAAATKNLALVGSALNGQETNKNIANALKPIRLLSGVTKYLNCKIEIRTDTEGVLAKITPDSDRIISDALLASGDTTISGVVERVGGATKYKCALRMDGRGDLLICSVPTKESAKSLGKYLYSDVVLDGRAEWLKGNWEIVSFHISAVRPAPQGAIRDRLKEMRKYGGEAWDKVGQLDDFLKSLRG